MNEYDIAYKLTMESIKKRLEKKTTREEALREFVDIGFMDINGNFIAPYQNLGRAIEAFSKKK